MAELQDLTSHEYDLGHRMEHFLIQLRTRIRGHRLPYHNVIDWIAPVSVKVCQFQRPCITRDLDLKTIWLVVLVQLESCNSVKASKSRAR